MKEIVGQTKVDGADLIDVEGEINTTDQFIPFIKKPTKNVADKSLSKPMTYEAGRNPNERS